MVGTREILTHDTQEIELSTVVDKGLERCRAGDWEIGLELLRKAARKEGKEIKFPSVYYSYLGYGAANFEGERRDGLALCRHAVKMDRYEPENWLNLARIYFLAKDRRRGVAALERGLKLDPRSKELNQLRRDVGYRQKPVIPFLSRDRWINRYLGERRHQRLLARDGLG